jgi:NitT/TauT family transport system substrate-binding protein
MFRVIRETKPTALTAGAALALAIAWGGSGPAHAEATEVRMAQQFGLLYLPQHVVVDKKMIEACAKDAGLGDVKVTLARFSGGAAVNQALLSGNVDFSAGGVGPMLTLWDKSKGSINVKGAITLAAMPLKLNSNDPSVKKIEDYVGKTDHKIALPSVKVSIQAVFLQMAAQKKWGKEKAFSLDELTVSMNHPTAAAAILAGGQAVKSHFATLPTSWQEVHGGKAHTVISSYDVIGGRHSTVTLYNTEKWRSQNPKLFKCAHSSFRRAIDWINANKKEAAGLFHRFTKSKLKLADVEKMVSDANEMLYTYQPERTVELAKFMHGIGSLKNQPASWKDYFWDENHDQNGS